MSSPNEDSSSSSSPNNSDKNANTNNTTDKSKGAIPKTKMPSKTTSSVAKKSVKMNNNLEDMPTLNCSSDLKRNGFAKCISVSNNFYKSPNSVLGADGDKLKSPCSDLLDYKFSCLNIPMGDEYIHGFMPFNGGSLLKETANDDVTSEEKFCPGNVYCGDQNWQQSKDSDSSSDDNELLSVSDDGCIYTYKADNVADLPSSFFNLELPPLENLELAEDNREGNSSPEMDFLEMDFDPGPSGDQDSDSIDQQEPSYHPPIQDIKETNIYSTNCSTPPSLNLLSRLPEEPNINYEQFSKIVKQVCVKRANNTPTRTEIKMPWSCSLQERTTSASQIRTIKRHHSSKGELVSPSECVPSSPSSDTNCNLWSFHNAMGKILVENKSTYEEQIEKFMVWTEQEACLKQVTQIAPSSCGAAAVLNVLNALRLPLSPNDDIQKYMNTRFRNNTAPLSEYLQSRSRAGCNHRDLIAGLYNASEGKVYSRFFAMYPERVVNLYKWLGYWIKQGAVPIATLNLQKCKGKLPDSWHHQMIFGVGPKGIYLTNPLECVEDGQLWPQLCSESVLLIRREDILSRWNPRSDLKELIKIYDVRWREVNVVGQVAKIVRESRREIRLGTTITSHVRIPAEYRSGITLAIDIKSPAFTLLRQCPELPLLHPNDTTIAFNVQN